MTSERLRRCVERELVRLHALGERDLVRSFLALDHGGDFARLERYLEGCRELVRRARAAGAAELCDLLRYFVGRTLAYPLDRPKEALPGLIDLNAELATGPRRGSVVHRLAELELLRATHKIDAPGFQATIVAGVRALWPRLGDDLGPQTELLDIFWRTAYWCRDPALMHEARRLAQHAARSLRYSASYWHARELALLGRHEEAAALIAGLLEAKDEVEEAGELWRHYLSAELAANEAALGRGEEATRRLDLLVAELGATRDPMLLWDVARARAAAAKAGGDDARELAAWGQALDVVEGLGTDRLAAEFALSLATVADRCGDAAGLARARGVLATTLPALRSGADLREAARALPGLCS